MLAAATAARVASSASMASGSCCSRSRTAATVAASASWAWPRSDCATASRSRKPASAASAAASSASRPCATASRRASSPRAASAAASSSASRASSSASPAGSDLWLSCASADLALQALQPLPQLGQHGLRLDAPRIGLRPAALDALQAPSQRRGFATGGRQRLGRLPPRRLGRGEGGLGRHLLGLPFPGQRTCGRRRRIGRGQRVAELGQLALQGTGARPPLGLLLGRRARIRAGNQPGLFQLHGRPLGGLPQHPDVALGGEPCSLGPTHLGLGGREPPLGLAQRDPGRGFFGRGGRRFVARLAGGRELQPLALQLGQVPRQGSGLLVELRQLGGPALGQGQAFVDALARPQLRRIRRPPARFGLGQRCPCGLHRQLARTGARFGRDEVLAERRQLLAGGVQAQPMAHPGDGGVLAAGGTDEPVPAPQPAVAADQPVTRQQLRLEGRRLARPRRARCARAAAPGAPARRPGRRSGVAPSGSRGGGSSAPGCSQ